MDFLSFFYQNLQKFSRIFLRLAVILSYLNPKEDPAKLQFHVKQRSVYDALGVDSYREITLSILIDGIVFNKAEPIQIRWDGSPFGSTSIVTQVSFHQFLCR